MSFHFVKTNRMGSVRRGLNLARGYSRSALMSAAGRSLANVMKIGQPGRSVGPMNPAGYPVEPNAGGPDGFVNRIHRHRPAYAAANWRIPGPP